MKARAVLRWSLLAALAGVLLAALLGLWLARSEGGRDWLLARALGVLPPGATLQWQALDGTLAGPLEIRGLHYTHEGTQLRIARLHIDHGFWPLLSGRLQIRALTLDNVQLDLPPDDEPFTLPRWPEVLPTLDVPIKVAVQRLRLRGMQVRRAGEPLLTVARIDGGFTLAPGALALRDLRMVSNRGTVQVAGDYVPADNFRTRLRAQLALPAIGDAPPAQLRLVASGDLDDLQLRLDGRAPAPLTLRLRLRDGAGQPRWEAEAASDRLLLAHLGIDADPAAYAFQLNLGGVGGAATLRGQLSRDDLQLRITPSQLRLAQGVLTFAPLALETTQGPLRLQGTLALAGADSRFDLRVGSDALLLQGAQSESTPVQASGEMRLIGRWRDYRLTGRALLRRDGQEATVTLAGRGDPQQLRLAELAVLMPEGRLDGDGELRWTPALGGRLDAKLAGFDPGYFFPDFPGALHGQLQAEASRDPDGAWRGQAQLQGLGGSLRGRAISGSGQASYADGSGEGTLDLRLGGSHITGGGRFGERLDLQARFSPLDLADVLPGAAGRIQGRAVVRGSWAAAAYEADLTGSQLRWNDWAAATLTAQGVLPASGRDGNLRVRATGLAFDGQTFDAATLDLQGSLADIRARADVRGEAGSASLALTAARRGQGWQGRLEQLAIAPRLGAPWALQGGTNFAWNDGDLRVDRGCLAPAAGKDAALCVSADGRRAVVDGKALPWSLAQPWLGARGDGLEPFGVIDLEGLFTRAPAGAWIGKLQVRSASGGLRIDPQVPRNVFAYNNLQLDLELLPNQQLRARLQAALARGGSLSGEAQGGLAAEAPLIGTLRLDVRDLTWMELLSTDLAGPGGQILGSLRVDGTRAAPLLSGDARLVNFSAELPTLGVQLRDGTFALRGEPGGLARLSGQVTSGAGQLRVDGSVNLRDAAAPVQLALRGENVTVADTPDLEATMSPDLTLVYQDGILKIRGVVSVPSAEVDLERLDTSVSPSPDVVVLDPREPATGGSAFLVDTEVELRLGEDVVLRGFGLDGKLGGTLGVVDRPERAPRLTGTLQVSGTYAAYGQPLEITRGRLSYVNSPMENPALDIVAEREFDEATVGVRVRGTALAPETTVTSTPQMATAEALSWLVLGRPLSTASGTDTQRISASALALSAGSNLLAQRLGARLGLDAAGITENRALGGSTLLVGKQLSPRLFVSYGLSLVGTGQVVTLKYLLSRGLNISIESGDIETAASINWRKEK